MLVRNHLAKNANVCLKGPSRYPVCLLAIPFIFLCAEPSHAQFCQVFCNGGLAGDCPSDAPGCDTPQECLDNICDAFACGFGCGTITDCKFNGASILPPPACGNGLRERGEDCDGAPPLNCCGGTGEEPCTNCTCPPGSPPPGDCGDNIVNRIGEECDGTDDAGCPGSCRADCTCRQYCQVFCDGGMAGDCPSDAPGCSTPQECLANVCDAFACGFGCGTITDCKFNGVSILPPPVCGNGLRDRGEDCDGDPPLNCCGGTGEEPCTNCTCPPGSPPPGDCGDNIVNRIGEECDGTDDAGCPGSCRADCTCRQYCQVFCDGGMAGDCPSDAPGCSTPQECLANVCDAFACGFGCGTITDCKFNGVSILPPPVCGNGLRDRGEDCDGDPPLNCCGGTGEEPCTNCTCPPGSPPPGDCGDNIVNRIGEECDGTDDAGCPGSCRTDCTCPAPPGQVCGNNVREGTEQCDGTDDAACPDQCQANCTCGGPGQVCGNNVREGTEQCDGTDSAGCPVVGCQSDCTCSAPIPTVSEWGLLILALSLLTGAKLRFGRRPTTEAK